jgi:DMSO/TMAO reductase YedYZ molybdopterin-dependent catalytic subunit
MKFELHRRQVIAGLAAGLAGFAGYQEFRGDRISHAFMDAGDDLTRHAQRLLMGSHPLVREFTLADISADFPTNGTILPKGDAYQRMIDTEFADWALSIDGLVERPVALSLATLRGLPSRTQITQHNCDEGWSAIGQWKGVELGHLLTMTGLKPEARYVVFHCLDIQDDGKLYYESIDLFDAVHPQTILAYEMNGKPLPVGHGAPLRLRIELQIGYKNAKYVDRIEVVDSLNSIGDGRGGWWEDFDRATWYAGQ